MMIRDLDDIDRELSGDDNVSRKKLWKLVFSEIDALSDDEWQTVARASRRALQNLAKRRKPRTDDGAGTTTPSPAGRQPRQRH